MEEINMKSVQDDVKKRQQRVDQLDDKVFALSRQLIEDEVKSTSAFIENEYFLKVSDPLFGRFSVLQQMLFLSLWYHQRGRSAPGNFFSIECQKVIDGVLIDFIVHLLSGKNSYKVAIESDSSPEKRRKIESFGLPVLSYTEAEIIGRSPAIADEIFTFLDNQAEEVVSNQFVQSLFH